MKYTKLIISIVLIIGGCAQVPKEAVELSATVGRDLVEMKKSHIELVKLYYAGLINDINEFIDDVYLPYQIQRTLSDDMVRDDMLSSIIEASKLDASGKSQKDSFEKLKFFHQIIHEEVEAYRTLKLVPIKEEYNFVLDNINKSYDQIHYANSIVTGHLASVVKVHDTQNELLEKVDLKDIRTKVGVNTANFSDEIAELVVTAKEKDADLEKIVYKFEKLSNSIK
jgi:hypothetical protein